MAERRLAVRVLTPEGVVFEGAARSLVAPAWDGRVGIFPGHAPFLALSGEGPLDVRPESGGNLRFHLSGGLLKVDSDRVTVVVDQAVRSENEGGAGSGRGE